MLEALKRESELTYTENGARAHSTSGSYCLDLFSTIGALRHAPSTDITTLFDKALIENPTFAMRILFYSRDIRGGLGERRVFRIILKHLAKTHPRYIENNLELVSEYGRYDDLLVLLKTSLEDKVIDIIKKQLKSDKYSDSVSLLAKWLPSVNASSIKTRNDARYLASKLEMSEKNYRKLLVDLRNKIKIIENNLRTKKYDFEYRTVPSKALFKYKEAFIRNDKERYMNYLNDVSLGNVKMNTDTLMPYEIIEPIIDNARVKTVDDDKRQVLNTTWNALKDYTNDEDALVVVDGSLSMYWSKNPSPASVAMSLGIYYAEHNKGKFKNHFMTFSSNPKLIEIKGNDIYEKLEFITSFCEAANTNVLSVFILILNTAIKYNYSSKDMPSKLYIISDMEFDDCVEDTDRTTFEHINSLYEYNGYKVPKLVFWNVNSRNYHQPVRYDDNGVVLVSGCNHRIFKLINKNITNPYNMMVEIINSKRYQPITINI